MKSLFCTSLFFILISVIKIAGQENYYTKIDSSLQYINADFQKKGKIKEAILFNEQMLELSRKHNYPRGIGWSYLNIGNSLSTLTHYRESLKYLDLAEKEFDKTEELQLKTKTLIEIGKVNHFLGLYNVSLAYYNKAIELEKQNINLEIRKKNLSYVYACKADNFEYLKEYDSLRFYFQKAYQLVPDPITAANIANYFIVYKKDDIDSANYYLKISNDKILTDKYDLFQKLVVLEKYGNYYYEIKDYIKALSYFLQALRVANVMVKTDIKANIYQSISKTYQKLHDSEKSAEYYLKYSTLNNSLNSNSKQAINFSIDKLIKEKEVEKEKEKSKLIFIVSFISIIGIILMIIGYFFYIRKTNEKENYIQFQQEKINQKDIEKRQLEYKVNDAFEEVLLLAKNNAPAFLARFKEVYPEFCEKLLEKYPQVLNSELIFCAYLKLNFSTKEIASSIFVTEKAIQVRKSRLRKKFNIPSEKDLYLWITKI